MRCRSARAALFERELGTGSQATNAALTEHLATCAACAAREAAERGLSETLESLRNEPPPPIDVTARVLCELPRIERASGEEVSSWQLGWATAAALACCAGLVAGLWNMLPALAGAARDAWTLTAGLARSLGSIGAAAATLISSGFEIARRLVETLAPMASALRGLEPIAIGSLGLCAAVMAVTIVLVVGRDLRTRVLSGKGSTI